MPDQTCEIDGIRLTSVEGDHISNILKKGIYYERDLLEAITEMGLEGTYVDVGAFVGTHALWFAMKCPSVDVVAIEPNKESFRYLRKNVRDNGQQHKVRLVPCAVHNEYTQCEVVVPNTSNLGSSKIRRSGDIEAKRLDDLLADVPKVALIKIDVEGSEVSVLASAKETIRKHKPVLVMEAWNGRMRRAQQVVLPDYEVVARYCSTPTLVWLPKGGT